MLLVVQHPIADLRPFIGADSGVLGRPVWPSPDPVHDYIRGTGRVRRRLRGGVDDWSGEDLYGDASRALRFGDRLGLQPFGLQGQGIRVRSSFRRFLSSGTVGRFEVGLDLDTQARDYLSVAAHMVQMPVTLRSGKQIKLIDAGSKLAAQMLDATTRHAEPGKSQAHVPATQQTLPSSVHRWWMAAGNPLMVVEFHASERAAVMPAAAQPVAVSVADTRLWHAWIQLGDALYLTWLIERGTDESAVRRLRINLSRLHAERECLRLVLQAMAASTRLAITEANSDGIQAYLNDAVRGLQKPQRFGIEQSPILEASMGAVEFASPGQSASLDSMRRQVKHKVDAFIRRQENKMVQNIHNGDVYNGPSFGDVGAGAQVVIITAEKIDHAFNNAFQTVKDAEGTAQQTKDKLDELLKQVQLLVPQLPDETTKAQVLADVATITTEATSPQPRLKNLQFTGDGLIDAAKTVAKMVPSITSAVAGLLALFA